jgi:hypothetical protein
VNLRRKRAVSSTETQRARGKATPSTATDTEAGSYLEWSLGRSALGGGTDHHRTSPPERQKRSLSETDEALQPIHAFGIQHWLASLSEEVFARCSKGNFRTRPLQNGLAWRSFRGLIRNTAELEVVKLLGSLLRYANSDESEAARLLFRGYVPLSLEHDAFGEFIGIETLARLANSRRSIALVHHTLRRWCDWIESIAHCQTHLACLGSARSYFEADKAVILLWPLAKRHNWTCRDLKNVLCMVSRHPGGWLCRSESQVALKIEALGMRPLHSASLAEGPPSGSSIALRYSQFWAV